MALNRRILTDDFAVAPQIEAPDIEEIARLGYRVLINNRPDGEDPGQPTAADHAAQAAAAGLVYHHLPVTAQTMGPAVWEKFTALLQGAEGPVLAHCRSGTRSCHLWAFSQASGDQFSLDEIVSRGAEVGYDLSPLLPTLRQIRGR